MTPLWLRNFVARSLLFPIEDFLRQCPISRFYRFYRRAQWWSRKEIEEYQGRALSALIRHAYESVPYYREMMRRAGIGPEDIRCPDDLRLMPVLTRNDVVENLPSLLTSTVQVSSLVKGSSSGTTGTPVSYFHDKLSVGAAFGAERVGWEISGYRFGSRNVTVWGNRITVEEQWTRWGSRLKAWAFQNKRIGACLLTNASSVRRALEQIREHRADYVTGYPSAIYFLALKAQELGIVGLRCKGVLTTAETVYDFQRQKVGEVFGPVYDGYGSGEIPGVAYQCAKSGLYHIVDPHVIVEFQDIGAENFKELVLTNLDNYAMPMIRYRIGDLAIPSTQQCACGRQWETLKAVVGRTNDLITTPSGGALLVPSFFGSSMLSRLPQIHQYQIAKIREGKIVVRIVAHPLLSKMELDLVDHQIGPYLKGVMEYELKQVDQIPNTGAGKFRLVVDETAGS